MGEFFNALNLATIATLAKFDLISAFVRIVIFGRASPFCEFQLRTE